MNTAAFTLNTQWRTHVSVMGFVMMLLMGVGLQAQVERRPDTRLTFQKLEAGGALPKKRAHSWQQKLLKQIKNIDGLKIIQLNARGHDRSSRCRVGTQAACLNESAVDMDVDYAVRWRLVWNKGMGYRLFFESARQRSGGQLDFQSELTWTSSKGPQRQVLSRWLRKMFMPHTITGSLELLAGPPGAEVVLDGAAVGILPLRQTLTVQEGAHEILVRRDGYSDWTRRIEVSEGDNLELTVEMSRNVLMGLEEKDASEDRRTGVQGLSRKTKIRSGGIALGVGAACLGYAALMARTLTQAAEGQQFYAPDRSGQLLTGGIAYYSGIVLTAAGAAMLTWGILSPQDSNPVEQEAGDVFNVE